jgi:1,2-diacylglycerol 3-beta-galactosyltransferase
MAIDGDTETGPDPGAARRVLFLFSDTGAGHRRAAEAVVEALTSAYPGTFVTVLCDPLMGPGAARPLRWLARLYGPAVRLAPWAWGAAYYVSNSRLAMTVFWRTAFSFANGAVRAQVAMTRPDVIVSCHPLTGRAAMLATRDGGGAGAGVPVVTLVTDLAATHISWRYPQADLVMVPTATARAECLADGVPVSRCAQPGLPVGAPARKGPLPAAARARLRRSLGLGAEDFVVLVAGGGEGCGGLYRRTASILRQFEDVHVVTACGRNRRLRRRLSSLAGRADGRLTVLGFVGNFTDWLRCADVVVTKAGPGIIAEAACCGPALLLTSHLPGQERGNIQLVVRAGAGRWARGIGSMLRELGSLRSDPAALAAMRAGSRSLARPDAAAEIADMIAGLAGQRTPFDPLVADTTTARLSGAALAGNWTRR